MVYDKPGKCEMDGTELVKAEEGEEHKGHASHHEHMVADFRKRFFVSIILTVPVLALSPLIQKFLRFSLTFAGDKYLLFFFSAVIFFYGGWPFLKGLIEELEKRQPGMMTLIALAVSVAFFYSAAVIIFGLPSDPFFWELATLIDIMLLGHWIEMRSIMGASKALEALARLMPSEAHLVKPDDSIVDVPVAKLVINNVVLVKPGEKVPSDGVVVEGDSNVNESMLTGESKPVSKKKNDKVIGGSVNGEGALHIKVLHTGEDSYLSQVIKLVKEAQESKSKTQDLANMAASWLTIIAVSVGTLTLVSWLWFGEKFVFALERMVTVMVISCPHALGLAVPLVVAVSTSLSARNGLLIRNRAAFERARNIDAIVFDKTGTLTKGEFGVTDIVALGSNEKDILFYAASLESSSEHPIAKGIVKKAKDNKILIGKVEKFLSIPGKGVQGVVKKRQIRVVGINYLKENKIIIKEKKVSELSEQGKTVVYVLDGKKPIGVIALADLIREESKEAISKLKAMGIKCMMLTGDNKQVAKWVAKELGLDDFFAEVLPHEKSKTIKEIQQKGLSVAMVGDGVNDAPALTQADVGIAIGAGTDVAIESADIILVRNDPRDVASVMGLAKATYSKMKQNLLWATGYNVVAIPLAAGVLYSQGIVLSPALGAVFMSLSTVIVSINASFLRVKK